MAHLVPPRPRRRPYPAPHRLRFPNDDWAFGYWKLECNGDEYVSGVGEDATSNGRHRGRTFSDVLAAGTPPSASR